MSDSDDFFNFSSYSSAPKPELPSTVVPLVETATVDPVHSKKSWRKLRKPKQQEDIPEVNDGGPQEAIGEATGAPVADDITAEDTPEANRGKRLKPWMPKLLKDAVIILVVASVASWAISTFLLRTFYIPSESMENTLQVDDRILVNLLAPEITGLERGDVIVFTDPGGWLDGDAEGGYLVKRIIGLPGDHVVCCDEFGAIQVNGESLDEPYLKEGVASSEITFDETVPEGMVWVMGDNRLESLDSRYHEDAPNGKFVPISDIVGRGEAVIWPLSNWSLLVSSE
jgi:signal peptidase I